MVVAAVNRLDGRQYAVKRIRLDSASPAAFARLLREVATLSRLQHAHVVRYFQVDTLYYEKPLKHPEKVISHGSGDLQPCRALLPSAVNAACEGTK